MRSDELATPDCPPLRIRLLGENLIAFRATSGKVGLVANACPHRGASMFFGRNEEEGLRCVYHGWKFDVSGACIDMPSEPPESNFKSKVRTLSYPCEERNGTVWAYMGPRETPPPLPAIEANLMDGGVWTIQTIVRDCNWLQAIEGDIDTSHATFLHYGSVTREDALKMKFDMKYLVGDGAPKFYVRETNFGATYAASRAAEDDQYYWRIANFLLPFYSIAPGASLRGATTSFRGWIPIDDDHSMYWGWNWRPGTPGDGTPQFEPPAFLPSTTDWNGRWHLPYNRENDYLIDRELQAQEKSPAGYTGIRSIHLQDQMITESMGPVYNRSREHLGTTDAMIIRTRRLLMAAAKAYRDNGALPEGVDNPDVFRQHCGWVLLPRSADIWEATESMRGTIFNRLPAEPPSISTPA